MKYNIKRTDYDRKPCSNGKWWSWDQKCDRCGADCQCSDVMTLVKPNLDEVDFCILCYRELMDQNIPYKEAYKRYKKKQ